MSRRRAPRIDHRTAGPERPKIFEVNPTSLLSICQTCGGEGRARVVERPRVPGPDSRRPILPGVDRDDLRKFCTCPEGKGGPYVAPKGYIAKFTFGDDP